MKENEHKEDIKRHKEKSEMSAIDDNRLKVGDELETVKKESHKLKEQIIALEKIVEQSNNIAEDHKTQNDNLRQKTLTLSKKLRTKNNELKEKNVEFKTAIDVIKELRGWLLELGEDLSDVEDKEWLQTKVDKCYEWASIQWNIRQSGEGEKN